MNFRMPFAGGNYRHIMVEGFLIYGVHEIERMEPFHAFDIEQLKGELSSRLKDVMGAVLKFTMEEIRPTDCISHSMEKEIRIEIIGHVPQELRENLMEELVNGD